MQVRAYYSNSVYQFLLDSDETIIGILAQHHRQDLVIQQTNAWREQISILKNELRDYANKGNAIFFEFVIPRMGKRVDIVLVICGAVFVVEFKVGADRYFSHDRNQVIDYALDLKNFHEGSHRVCIVPVLLSTEAPYFINRYVVGKDGFCELLCTNRNGLGLLISEFLMNFQSQDSLEITVERCNWVDWVASAYKPTPTIIQAAQALYQGHDVSEISRNDAGAQNLSATTLKINEIIEIAKSKGQKAICFVTGVPGAGKTLAGLNVTTSRMQSSIDEHAVFLSGNGPLVDVLREALARDDRDRNGGRAEDARRRAGAFIQNIHHFRDDNLRSEAAPIEKVIVYDEAQRAWDRDSTAKFMQQKRDRIDFNQSEPEFLIGIMDRHTDWCVVVALIGGGQEINTGEAGLPEWFSALRTNFTHWEVFYSDRIGSSEYIHNTPLLQHLDGLRAESHSSLHLGVSLRSFRAEKLSDFIGAVIDGRQEIASQLYESIESEYPILLTRSLETARMWLKARSRGSELCGLVASSGANRLKPEGVFVKLKISPAEWFLNGSTDVRSCLYLEDVATEFDIQGLELDWVGVCWDADFRYSLNEQNEGSWTFNAFKGTKWQNVQSESRRKYLANSYRVLLTRARQGLVIFVPEGSNDDPTRLCEYYDQTANFLLSCGITAI